MKIKNIAFSILLLLQALNVSAVVKVGLSIDGNNVKLSWPSVGGESYTIRYSPKINDPSAWVILDAGLPATQGGNKTTFIHQGGFNALPCSLDGGGTGPVLGPPVINSLSQASPEGLKTTKDKIKKLKIPSVPPLPQAMWGLLSLKDREIQEDIAASKVQGSVQALSTASQSACDPTGGFYQVFLAPHFYFDYSQHVFSNGPEFLPLNLGGNAPEKISQVDLLIDEEVFRYTELALENYNFGTSQFPNYQETYGIWVELDRLVNGSHVFNVKTKLQLSESISGTTPYLALCAQTFTATVNNLISFASWEPIIVGGAHTFSAKSRVFPAVWTIAIYDAFGDSVMTKSGTTLDGNIEWTWDLRDFDGVLRNSLEYDSVFDPYVTIAYTSGSPSLQETKTKPAPLAALDYPDKGQWLFAIQDKDAGVPAAKAKFIETIEVLAGGPTLKGLPASKLLLRYGPALGPIGMEDIEEDQMIRNESWAILRNALQYKEIRNFYYYGHGGGEIIGGDLETLNGSKVNHKGLVDSTAFIKSSWVRENVTFNSKSGENRFRFVFLDGCSTANGDWPQAFGIEKDDKPLPFYENPGRNPKTRPNAFVGWSDEIAYVYPLGATKNGFGDYQKFAYFRTQWMFNWIHNSSTPSLIKALEQARTDSGWVSPSQFLRLIRIYGYKNLEFNEYNARHDWQ